MTQKTLDSFTENIPAYVLGALGRVEADALKVHLETCEVCRAELARYQQIGDGLMTALPLQVPSPAIKGKLLRRLGKKGILHRARIRWSFRQIAGGAVALVLIGTNLTAFQQIRDLRQQHAQLSSQVEKNHTILGMLTSSTEIHPVSSNAVTGNLLLNREQNQSYLLMWNLPPLANGLVYQVWLVGPNGERVDAGSFLPEVNSPFTSVPLNVNSRSLAEFVGIEVTIEPQGGSTMPTGEQILNTTY